MTMLQHKVYEGLDLRRVRDFRVGARDANLTTALQNSSGEVNSEENKEIASSLTSIRGMRVEAF